MTVRHLLEQKGRNVWTIRPDSTVFDALAKMAEKDIGSLVVMDGEKLVGIVTERHYSRNVILKGKKSPTTVVSDIMERDVIHVRPEQSVELCMALMTEQFGPGATNLVGPVLNGLDGRHSGSVAGFNYSDANKNSGIVWSEQTFGDYIKDPKAKIPGTKMVFAGIKNEQEAKDLWAYLKQFDAQGNIKK